MRRVHVLADRFTTQNSSAILAPLVRFRTELREAGIDVRLFFDASAGLKDADAVIVVDRYVSAAVDGANEDVSSALRRLIAAVGPVHYLDTTDSSGLLRVEVLPFVAGYLKPFLLRDRTAYLTAHYGGRLFTDYYHRRHGVEDRAPQWSEPVPDAALLSKLHLAWSPAVYRYDLVANRLAKLYRHLPWRPLLRWPAAYRAPLAPRSRALSCRISVGHGRETVSYQRLRLRTALATRVDTSKVPRRAYYKELRSSRAVLSPFGWGEFALRDYETFVAGAALVKPDMGHLETWPALYQANRTYMPVDWDLNTLPDVLSRVEDRPDECVAIATAGQEAFRDGADNGPGFARRLNAILDGLGRSVSPVAERGPT